MKKLELKYRSFNELPIGKYFQIKEELTDITDEQERVFTLIASLCEVEVEDVYKSPMKELSALINEIKWFSEPVKPTKAPRRIKLGGFTLKPSYDVKDINVQQYIDYSIYSKDREKFYVENLCTFLIPEGKVYNDGYDIVEVQNVVREQLSIQTSESLYMSFAKSSRRLLNRSLRSLAMSLIWKIVKTRKQGMSKMRVNLMRTLIQMKWLMYYLNGINK